MHDETEFVINKHCPIVSCVRLGAFVHQCYYEYVLLIRNLHSTGLIQSVQTSRNDNVGVRPKVD